MRCARPWKGDFHLQDGSALWPEVCFFFFITLVTGPRRSLSLNLRDTRVEGREGKGDFHLQDGSALWPEVCFFFFTLVTGPRRSLSLKLSNTRVYAPQIRALLGTASHCLRCASPTGGPQPSFKKSTYPKKLTFRLFLVQLWSLCMRISEPPNIRSLNRYLTQPSGILVD